MSSQRGCWSISGLAAALCVLLPTVAAATDCSVMTSTFPVSVAATLDLTSSGLAPGDLQTAMGYWTGCAGYGSQMPALRSGGTGGIPVSINVIQGSSGVSGGSCGVTTIQPHNGRVASATITLWTQQADGTSCAPISDCLAHEFGHLFGLGNAPDVVECDGHIMGRRTASGTRSVAADDCEVARDRWVTPAEETGNAPPPASQVGGNSPIVLDLEGNGFRFTDLANGVEFDLDSDGVEERMSWLAPDSGDAFLALDRNLDGEITSGRELFGNYTPQPYSPTPNGFLALAVFDKSAHGGNEDGVIDRRDAVYPFLRLWIDEDHDGRSQSGELYSLGSLNVRSIDLGYVESRRHDRYGNQLRYRSHAEVGRRLAEVIDVFFLRETP